MRSRRSRKTLPINLDAIIFRHVENEEAAALKITNYRETIDRVARTCLQKSLGRADGICGMRISASAILRLLQSIRE